MLSLILLQTGTQPNRHQTQLVRSLVSQISRLKRVIGKIKQLVGLTIGVGQFQILVDHLLVAVPK